MNEVLAADDQQLVQALTPDRPDQRSTMAFAFGARTGVQMIWTPVERQTSSNALVNLASPVADQEPERGGLVVKRGDKVAGLLDNPRPGRVGGDTSHVHPPAPQFDDEQHLHALQEHRVDGEESGRGESHPPALAEPCVNLSAHPAPITQPYGHAPSRQCANRVGSRLAMSARNRLARLR
jgi:hypothetical protein